MAHSERASNASPFGSILLLAASFMIFIVVNAYKTIFGYINEYINERIAAVTVFFSIIILIVITIFKKLFIKNNNFCIYIFTAKYAPRFRVVEETTRLSNMLKVLSRHGVVRYSLDEGRLELRLERSTTRLSSLFGVYGRGLIMQHVGTCNTTEKCKIVYFNDISEINIKCKKKIVILFKHYQIHRNKYDNIIDLSNIIGINEKIRFLKRQLQDVLRQAAAETELCIILVDPVEYNTNDINNIIKYIKKYIKNVNVRIKCIIAINAIEKHIYHSL